MKQNKRLISFAFAWLLASGIAVFLRLYPLMHHAPSDATEKATMIVISNVRQKATDAINAQFPDMNPAQKKQLIQKNMNGILRAEKNLVRQTIEKLAHSIAMKSDDAKSYPYLLASDSYYYYNLTENIVRTGRISQQIKGSKYFNKLMLAPLGFWEPLNLHPYVGFILYQIMKLFNTDVPLMYAVSYTPLVISVLTLIPFLWICASMGCSPFVSFISATLFSTASIYLKRSMFGWYDNDPYSLFFPVLILSVLFYALEHISKRKTNIQLAIVCALLVTAYSLFWHGWMFFLSVILIAGILFALYNHFIIRRKSITKNYLIFGGTILGGTLIGITLVFGIKEFFILFREGWSALKDFLQPQFSLWPNLYFSVGELKQTPYRIIIDATGGFAVFLLALIGLGAATIKAYQKSAVAQLLKIMIIFVFLATALVLSHGALRFALLFLIPVSLLFPLGLEHLLERFRANVSDRYPKRPSVIKFSQFMARVTCLAVLVFFLHIRYNDIPLILNKIFNATWEKSLTQVKATTPSNSIINTWWTPGHFIKAIAQRRVTFDGATINNPQGYWLAKVFLSTDEKQALGILRMLNDSANQAAEYLQKDVGLKLSKAVNTLTQISSLNTTQARAYLLKNTSLNQMQVAHLLELTHRRPPPSYIMIFNEMIEKNIQFKLLSGWNFEKAEELRSDPQKLKELPDKKSKEYIQFLWRLVGGPYRYSGPLNEISRKGKVIFFNENVAVNMATKECIVSSKTYGKGVPQSLFYLEGDKIVEKKFPKASLSYSVIVAQDRSSFTCVLMDRPLAQSLLMQLYFFGGKGFKYISPFIAETDPTRRTRIYFYKVDWDKFFSGNDK